MNNLAYHNELHGFQNIARGKRRLVFLTSIALSFSFWLVSFSVPWFSASFWGAVGSARYQWYFLDPKFLLECSPSCTEQAWAYLFLWKSLIFRLSFRGVDGIRWLGRITNLLIHWMSLLVCFQKDAHGSRLYGFTFDLFLVNTRDIELGIMTASVMVYQCRKRCSSNKCT